MAEITSNLIPGITNVNFYKEQFFNPELAPKVDVSFKDPNGNTVKYCNQFTSEDSYYYKVGPIDKSVNVPRTNVDNFL